MAKHLRLIVEKNIEGKDTNLKGVNKSTSTKVDVSDLVPDVNKGNVDFARKHDVEKHDDRVGNGEEDYKGKTKQASEKRHGNITKQKSEKEYSKFNEEKCESCEGECSCGSKGKSKRKLLLGGKKGLEERHMTSSEKTKEKKLKAKLDPSEMKASMINQYGKEKGIKVYFATIRKKAMAESYDKKKD